MSDAPRAPPGDCNKQIYNAAERAILDPYKAEYISTPSKAARKQFFTSRIWPAMYRYWIERNSVSSNLSKVKAQDLSDWIYNNWRLPHTGGKTKGLLMVRKSDVIWTMRQADVWKEIAQILNVPEASTRTEKWFQTRTVAIQNIMLRMDENETKLLEQQVRDIEANGYPEEQKRAFAEKHCTRRLDSAAKAHYLEMGLLTLSVVAYRRTDGRLSVEIHENTSNLVGVGDHCFDDEHEGKAREIRRVWLDYVQNILEEKEGGPAPIVRADADADALCTSQDGFPMFPNGFSVEKLKKKQGEKMLREYLKKNYALATGRQSDEVPYKEMTKSIAERRKFVHDRFLPRGFILRDPHNLKLEEIHKMLRFLWDRQQSVEPAQVFRFHAFKASRKGLEITPSMYSDEIDPENPPEIRKKKPRKQKRTAVLPRNAENVPREAEHTAQILNQPGLYTMSATPEPQRRQATGDTGMPTASHNISAASPPQGPADEPMPIMQFPDWGDGGMAPPIDAGSVEIFNPIPNAREVLPVDSWATNAFGNGMSANPVFGIATPANPVFQNAPPANHAFGNATPAFIAFNGMSANNAFGHATSTSANNAFGMSANNDFGHATSADNAFGNAMSANNAFGNAVSANNAFGNAMSANHLSGNAMSADDAFGNAMSADHLQIYEQTRQFVASWNQNLNQPMGINGYAPGPEGIDYGVPLNLESVERQDNNAEDSNADNPGIPTFVAEHEMWNQHNQGTLNQFTAMVPQEGSTRATTNPSRGKRTADDIAAAEAQLVSSALGAKRKRKPKVRES